MLLDEPTLGLDVLGTQVVTEFIGHVRGEGKAIILCTHHLDEAERICTRFGLMHHGRIVAEGTLAELRDRTGCSSLVEMFLKLSVSGPVLAGAGGGSRRRLNCGWVARPEPFAKGVVRGTDECVLARMIHTSPTRKRGKTSTCIARSVDSQAGVFRSIVPHFRVGLMFIGRSPAA